jgi:DNA polymerase-3 subunit alpha
MSLCNYVWNVLVATSRGYGFNLSHTLAYSLIALQEMNLAYKYPIMFWNCACLISDAGGAESDEATIEESESKEVFYEDYEGFEEFIEAEDEEDEEEDDEEEAVTTNKKKKKVKSTNYGKIASAIGKIKSSGVNVAPPDINKSTYTFSPDIEGNTIRYGLSGITKVGEELVKTIMEGRPYASVTDFLERIKINKPQMVNLIKSGAFDCFGDRVQIMRGYIDSISDVKKRITLQNMKMLIDFGLIPDDYDLERRVYNFNKYIKKLKLDGVYFGLDDIAFNFYSAHFDIDKLEPCDDTESGFKIKQATWENYYQKHMGIVRPFVQKHAAELLVSVNNRLTQESWNKYCLGSLSKWEMDSVSFYSHEHELINLDMDRYELTDFADLPEEPVVDRVIPIKGKQVPILKLFRICGTVLDRDKSKKTVTLLTTSGVVTVKIFGGVFAQYDKQISERGADGKKHVIEKSMFSRGNKIIVIGVRDGDAFRAKKYSRTPFHLVEQIVEVHEDGTMITKSRGEQD